jgi:hypothetical protein
MKTWRRAGLKLLAVSLLLFAAGFVRAQERPSTSLFPDDAQVQSRDSGASSEETREGSMLDCATSPRGGGGFSFYDPSTLRALGCAEKCVDDMCLCLDSDNGNDPQVQYFQKPPKNYNCSAILRPVGCRTAIKCISTFMQCVEDIAEALAAAPTRQEDSGGGIDIMPVSLPVNDDACLTWATKLSTLVRLEKSMTDTNVAQQRPLFIACQHASCGILASIASAKGLEEEQKRKSGSAFLASCAEPAASTGGDVAGEAPGSGGGGVASPAAAGSSSPSAASISLAVASKVCPARRFEGQVDEPLAPPPPVATVKPSIWDDAQFCGPSVQSKRSSDEKEVPTYLSDGYIFSDSFPVADVLAQCPTLSKCARSCFDLFISIDPAANGDALQQRSNSARGDSLDSTSEACSAYADSCLRAAAECLIQVATSESNNNNDGGQGGATAPVVPPPLPEKKPDVDATKPKEEDTKPSFLDQETQATSSSSSDADSSTPLIGPRPDGSNFRGETTGADADSNKPRSSSARDVDGSTKDESESTYTIDAAFCSKWAANVRRLYLTATRNAEAFREIATTACATASCSVMKYVSSNACSANDTSWTNICKETFISRTMYDRPLVTAYADGIRPSSASPKDFVPGPTLLKAPAGGADGGAEAAENLQNPCPSYGGVTYYSVEQLFALQCPGVTACLDELCSCAGGLRGSTSCVFSSQNEMDCSMAPACLQKGYACVRRQAQLASNASSRSICQSWGVELHGGLHTASLSQSIAFTESDVYRSCRRDACMMLQRFISDSRIDSSRCAAALFPNESWNAVCSNSSGKRLDVMSSAKPVIEGQPAMRMDFNVSFPGDFDAVLTTVEKNAAHFAQLKAALESGLSLFIGRKCTVDRIFKGSLVASFSTVAAAGDSATGSAVMQNAAAITTSSDHSWMAQASTIVASLGGPPLNMPIVSSARITSITNYVEPSASSTSSDRTVRVASAASFMSLAVVLTYLL